MGFRDPGRAQEAPKYCGADPPKNPLVSYNALHAEVLLQGSVPNEPQSIQVLVIYNPFKEFRSGA